MSSGKLFLVFAVSAGLLQVAACRSKSDGVDTNPARAGTGGGGSGGRGGNGGRGGTGVLTTGGSGGMGGSAATGGSGGTGSSADAAREAAADSGDAPKADAAPDLPPDVRPDVAPDVAPDAPRNLGQGAACRANAECRSNFCVDGFCCNVACNEPCQACSNVKTGAGNGTCGASRPMVGMKCGQGCQQVLANVPAVVDKTCDAQGRCMVPMIPQNFELCADMDPCTTLNCDQDTRAHTARCVKIGCAAGMCCCDGGGGGRMCVRTAMCMGAGRACAPP